MNPISAFLVQNIVGVYFFYGLAFFAMGMALALVSRRTSEFKFARAIPPLAGFGILHGLHEWFEMFQRIATTSSGHVPGLLEETIRVSALAVSFLLLSAFGILLLRPNSERRFRVTLPLLGMVGVWVVSTWIAASIFDSPAEELLLLADVLSRYCLGIPGAFLGAWALMAQQRTFREHAMPQFGRDLVWCAAGLLLYGVFGQLFVHASPLVPSTVVNSALFLRLFGIPVQLFRAIMAATLAVFMVRALNAFQLESERQWTAANEDLRLATQELSLLLDLSNLLATPMSMPERLAGVLTEIVERLQFPDAGVILLTSRRTGAMQERASVGFAESDNPQEAQENHRLAVELGRQCAERGLAVCRHLDGVLIEFLPEKLADQRRCQQQASSVCTIAVPLMAQHKVIGSLILDRDRQADGRGLSYEEFTIILGAAQQLGLSIENARLHQETQEHEKRLGEMLHQVVEAQEAERQRIALELHDATGQSLTAIALGLRGVETMLSANPATAAAQVQELRSFSTAALGELRQIISDLRPSQLDDLGLVAAIQWYAQEFEKRYAVQTELKAKGERQRLPPEYETVLFRIIQEGLTNIAKHARATRATILLGMEPHQVSVVVEDNGRGFDPDRVLQSDKTSGWGLLGIQERARLLGGRCELDSAPGSGTRVRVTVPLEGDSENVEQDQALAG
jgi:signal transduction histidine kinase